MIPQTHTLRDSDKILTVEQVEAIAPGRAAALCARAWEVPVATIKPTDALRLTAWVSMGVSLAALRRRHTQLVIDRLAKG